MSALNESPGKRLQHLADKAMNWIGSVSSLVVHTFLFLGIFALRLLGFPLDEILLILTTVVSLEAIYLAIFIQMAVNRNTQSLEEVGVDLDEIQEDVSEIQEDFGDVQEGVEDLEEHVEELKEDLEEIAEEDEQEEESERRTRQVLNSIEAQLKQLMSEIEALKQNRH